MGLLVLLQTPARTALTRRQQFGASKLLRVPMRAVGSAPSVSMTVPRVSICCAEHGAQQRRAFRATGAAAAPEKPKRDLYEVLGVAKDANKDAIKRAYYRQAKTYHPDANKDDPNAAEKFNDVQTAYEVLSDESKRQAYDNFGHAGVEGMGGGGGPQGGGPGGADFSEFMAAEELFERFFGQRPGGGGRRGRCV